MSGFLPESLFGQNMLILVAGLIVSLFVGSWIYALDREQAVRQSADFPQHNALRISRNWCRTLHASGVNGSLPA